MAKRKMEVPNAIPIEVSVIGACLSEGHTWWQQVVRKSGGNPDSLFHDSELRLVSKAIRKVVDRGTDISDSSVENVLNIMGVESVIPDPRQLIIELQTRTDISTPNGLAKSLDILVEKRAMRLMLDEIEEVADTIMDNDELTSAEVSTILKATSTKHTIARETRTFKQLLVDMQNQPPAAYAIGTGLESLDSCLGSGGWEPGRTYVLAARPKIGKTTLMFNSMIAALDRKDNDVVVLAVSLETLENEFIYKMVSAAAFVNQNITRDLLHGIIKEKEVDKDDLQAIEEAQAWLASKNMYTAFISDIPYGLQSVLGILADIKMKHPDQKVIVFIDYLQLMVQDHGSAFQEISQMTRDLKHAAIEMEVPIVYLSQLNRGQGDESEMPALNRLRGSGSIEQDADAIMFLNRPGFYDQEAPQHIIEIKVAANRTGPMTKTIQARWDGAQNGISDMAAGLDAEDVEDFDDEYDDYDD